MDCLWRNGPAEVKAVHHALGRERGITANTVHSALKRLCEKGLLTRHKVSHAHVYVAALSRSEHQRNILTSVVHSLMGTDWQSMIAAFVGLTERLGRAQLEHMEKLVAERRRAAAETKG
jgi:predicted transcriptional regulator